MLCSRRAVLAGALAPALARWTRAAPPGETLAADWSRFTDRSTEFDVQRLTRPSYASSLCAPPGRAVSRRGDCAVVASRRTGSWQLLRIGLAHGEVRVLTAAAALHPSAYTLSSDDRAVYYFDGPRLMSATLQASPRQRLLWEAPAAPREGAGLSVAGAQLAWATPAPEGDLLWLVHTAGRQTPEPVFHRGTPLIAPALNPRRALLAWREDGALWNGEVGGRRARRLATAPGQVLDAVWGPDGQSLLYLLEPGLPGRSPVIREQQIDTRTDVELAPTSQFACFTRNADASVLAGASRSAAAPYISIVLRATRRELTLAERQAREAAATRLAFSPDSQMLLFQGEGEGAMTVYAVRLDQLIEPTAT